MQRTSKFRHRGTQTGRLRSRGSQFVEVTQDSYIKALTEFDKTFTAGSTLTDLIIDGKTMGETRTNNAVAVCYLRQSIIDQMLMRS